MIDLVNLGKYAQLTGAYSIVGTTGSMAAGLSAASPVFSFRWGSTTAGHRALIDRIGVAVSVAGTGFAAGVATFDAIAAREFTISDYGGIAAPTLTSATPSESGGTLGAATYFYVITALGPWGETPVSTERSGAIAGSTGSVTLVYTNYTNATAHRVYRGTTTGVYDSYQDDATSTFVDTGAGWIATTGVNKQETGQGTGLTLTTNNAKMMTGGATTALTTARISNTATLLAGTRTLDAQAFAIKSFNCSTSTNTVHYDGELFNAELRHPLVLAKDEGFVVRATVPATGVWVGNFSVAWREVK